MYGGEAIKPQELKFKSPRVDKNSTLETDEPTKKISLKYMRPLYNKTPLEITAHRGGGRNGDLLPASENSVEIIQLAPRLGATGVEIDVQQTRDGVLVLYHDERINDRLTHKTGIRGKLKEYS